jgi:tetratricopeptide (TPR) repeat protein
MNRRILYLLVASTLSFFSCKPKSNEADRWSTIYKNAYSNNDYITAIVALNQLVIIDTANAAAYYDSLAYYSIKKIKNYDAGKKYTDIGLKLNPNNAQLLEYKGIFLGSENKIEEAKAYIQKAYKNSGLNKHKYMYASLSFTTDNNLEAYIKTIDEILYSNSKPEKFEANVDAGTTQMVDLKASCYLDKAKIALNSNQIKLSLLYLDSALILTPNFQEALFYKEKITTGK